MNEADRRELEAYWDEFRLMRQRLREIADGERPINDDELRFLDDVEIEVRGWNEALASNPVREIRP